MEKKNLSIYVHIPFCLKKCDYCDFLSFKATGEEQAYYIRNLIKEVRNFEALSTLYMVKTVFFGGGTPSAIEPNYIDNVIQAIKNTFEMSENPEITIETNPGTLSADKLKAYRSFGINRLSMGLQSANDEELKNLGRIHTFADFKNNYAMARRLGFDNINVDIMSGLPEQTLAGWSETLKKVTELSPEHISAYSLQIEPGTPFYSRYGVMPGKVKLPDEDTERNMYHYTKTYLAERGYKRYEISNYAKEGYESKHNLVYWSMDEYIGFGLGASSFVAGKRFSNPKTLEQYHEHCRTAYSRFKTIDVQPQKSLMEEFMFLGLRKMNGISITAFEKMFRRSFSDVYGDVTLRLESKGLLKIDGDKIFLTDRGIDVSNTVLAEYLL